MAVYGPQQGDKDTFQSRNENSMHYSGGSDSRAGVLTSASCGVPCPPMLGCMLLLLHDISQLCLCYVYYSLHRAAVHHNIATSQWLLVTLATWLDAVMILEVDRSLTTKISSFGR